MKLMLSLDLPEDPMLVVIVVCILAVVLMVFINRHKTTLDSLLDSLFKYK